MPTVHVIIKGRVQGVFFRASAKEIADAEGVNGWIRNTAEGNVELMACGNKKSLEKFMAWCHHGPEKSKVSEVIITPYTVEAPFSSFEIHR